MLLKSISCGECEMTKELGKKQPIIGSLPVSPENEKQAAERRRLKDALEDDEVYEALAALHAETQAKNKP
jgi:hypothetical protein